MGYVVALLSLVVALVVVLLVGVLRSHADILRALHDMGVYADGRLDPAAPVERRADPGPAPERTSPVPTHVTGQSASGEEVSVPITDPARPTLVAFLTTGCITCGSFWEAIADGRAIEGLRTVVVTRSADAESPGAVRALATDGVPTVMSSLAWDAFEVPGAPYFVQLEGERVVGEGVASTWEQLLTMTGRAEADLDRQGRTRGRMSRRDVLRGGPPPRRSDREPTPS